MKMSENATNNNQTEQALIDMGNDFKEVLKQKDKKIEWYEWRMGQADRKLREILDDLIRTQTVLELMSIKQYKTELDKLRKLTFNIENATLEVREGLDTSSEDYTDFHLYLEDLD
jgi:soluble cytochrome b562